MKRLVMLLVLFGSMFVLGACDLLNNEENNGNGEINDVYYDSEAQELVLDYSLELVEVSDGELITNSDQVFLEIREASNDEWYEIDNVGSLTGSDVRVPLALENGVYYVRLIVKDDVGNIIKESSEYELSIDFMKATLFDHLWCDFDDWAGVVFCDYGLQKLEEASHTIVFEMSDVDVENWTEVHVVQTEPFKQSSYNGIFFFETEGTYQIRATLYDNNNVVLGTQIANNDLYIHFVHDYVGTPLVHHLDVNYEMYDDFLHMQWDAEGDFDNAEIWYTSDDGETWQFFTDVHRDQRFLLYLDPPAVQGQFKIVLLKNDDVVSEFMNDEYFNISETAVFGYFDYHFDEYNQEVNLYWDTFGSYNHLELYRKFEDGDYELLDSDVYNDYRDVSMVEYGMYQYKVVAVGDNGEMLDTILSKEFYVSAPPLLDYADFNFEEYYSKMNFHASGQLDMVGEIRLFLEDPNGEFQPFLVIDDLTQYIEHNYVYTSFPVYGEGTYNFRVEVYDVDGVLTDVYPYYEVYVDFNLDLYGNPVIKDFWVDYNQLSKTVDMYFKGTGTFDHYLVEVKEMDAEDWTVLVELPRTAGFFNYKALDGFYLYRVSTVLEDGTIYNTMNHQGLNVRNTPIFNSVSVYNDWQQPNVNIEFSLLHLEYDHIIVYRSIDDGVWEELAVLAKETYGYDDVLSEDGDYRYRLVAVNADGLEIDRYEYHVGYYSAPNYVWWANAYFDHNQGVRVDFNYEQQFITTVQLLKTADGGLTWEFVEEYQTSEDNYSQITYYEFDKGSFIYKVVGFNDEGIQLGEQLTNEVTVQFEQSTSTDYVLELNFDYNVYDKKESMSIYHNHNFYNILIEVSSDGGTTWSTLYDLPSYVEYIWGLDLENGQYAVRATGFNELGEVLLVSDVETIMIDNSRVLSDIGVYVPWYGSSVEVSWMFNSEDVASVQVERSDNGAEYNLVSLYGPLKTQILDSVTPGEYQYRVTLFDDLGNIIDQQESQVITVTD